MAKMTREQQKANLLQALWDHNGADHETDIIALNSINDNGKKPSVNKQTNAIRPRFQSSLEDQRQRLERAKAAQARQINPLFDFSGEQPKGDSVGQMLNKLAFPSGGITDQKGNLLNPPTSAPPSDIAKASENIFNKSYASQMSGASALTKAFDKSINAGIVPIASTNPFGQTTPTDFLSAQGSPFNINASAPLGTASAQNSVQRAKDQAANVQQAYKAVADAQQNVQGLDFSGYKLDKSRAYSTEKDTAGNIIGITPLGKPYEDPLIAQQLGGFKAKGSEGGAGNPFTPNLDKFVAKQDPMSQLHAWNKPDVNMDQEIANRGIERTNAGLTNGSTPQQINQNREVLQSMADNRMGQSNIGRVTSAEVATGLGADYTKTRFTPNGITGNQGDVAKAAMAQNLNAAETQRPTFTTEVSNAYSGATLPAGEQKKWNKAMQQGIDQIKQNNRDEEI